MTGMMFDTMVSRDLDMWVVWWRGKKVASFHSPEAADADLARRIALDRQQSARIEAGRKEQR